MLWGANKYMLCKKNRWLKLNISYKYILYLILFSIFASVFWPRNNLINYILFTFPIKTISTGLNLPISRCQIIFAPYIRECSLGVIIAFAPACILKLVVILWTKFNQEDFKSWNQKNISTNIIIKHDTVKRIKFNFFWYYGCSEEMAIYFEGSRNDFLAFNETKRGIFCLPCTRYRTKLTE